MSVETMFYVVYPCFLRLVPCSRNWMQTEVMAMSFRVSFLFLKPSSVKVRSSFKRSTVNRARHSHPNYQPCSSAECCVTVTFVPRGRPFSLHTAHGRQERQVYQLPIHQSFLHCCSSRYPGGQFIHQIVPSDVCLFVCLSVFSKQP